MPNDGPDFLDFFLEPEEGYEICIVCGKQFLKYLMDYVVDDPDEYEPGVDNRVWYCMEHYHLSQ